MADDAIFTQVYGMTETTCTVTMFPFPEDDKTDSVGYIVPNLDANIVDAEHG